MSDGISDKQKTVHEEECVAVDVKAVLQLLEGVKVSSSVEKDEKAAKEAAVAEKIAKEAAAAEKPAKEAAAAEKIHKKYKADRDRKLAKETAVAENPKDNNDQRGNACGKGSSSVACNGSDRLRDTTGRNAVK